MSDLPLILGGDGHSGSVRYQQPRGSLSSLILIIWGRHPYRCAAVEQ